MAREAFETWGSSVYIEGFYGVQHKKMRKAFPLLNLTTNMIAVLAGEGSFSYL